MRKSLPNVAVIMSLYISDDYEQVSAAISSILTQSYERLTLFVYADGAIDSKISQQIEKFKNEYFGKLVFYSSSNNRGLAFSLNYLVDKIINLGHYDFIARMDGDDISYSSRIERQIEFFNGNPEVDVVGTFCREFGASFAVKEKKLPVMHDDILKFSIIKCPFVHPTVMFKIRVFNEGNKYPLNTSLTEDMAFWFELLQKGYRFGNLSQILLDYRVSDKMLFRRRGIKKALSEVSIRLQYMRELDMFSFYRLFFILSRLFFHVLPVRILELLYKYAR